MPVEILGASASWECVDEGRPWITAAALIRVLPHITVDSVLTELVLLDADGVERVHRDTLSAGPNALRRRISVQLGHSGRKLPHDTTALLRFTPLALAGASILSGSWRAGSRSSVHNNNPADAGVHLNPVGQPSCRAAFQSNHAWIDVGLPDSDGDCEVTASVTVLNSGEAPFRRVVAELEFEAPRAEPPAQLTEEVGAGGSEEPLHGSMSVYDRSADHLAPSDAVSLEPWGTIDGVSLAGANAVFRVRAYVAVGPSIEAPLTLSGRAPEAVSSPSS